MHGKRLSNLTFSFNKSRERIDYIPNTENVVQTSYRMKTRKLISDENNLDSLFTIARNNSANTSFELDNEDNAKYNSYQENEEVEKLQLDSDTDEEFQLDDFNEHSTNFRPLNSNGVGSNTSTNEISSLSNGYYNTNEDCENNNVQLNGSYENLRNAVKKVHFNMDVTRYVEETNNNKLNPQEYKDDSTEYVIEKINDNEGLIQYQSWTPKSKTAKGIIEEENIRKISSKDNFLIQEKSSSTSSSSIQRVFNKQESFDFTSNSMPFKSSHHQSLTNKQYVNEMYHSSLMKSKSNDLASSPTVFHRKLTVSMNNPTEGKRHELFINKNVDVMKEPQKTELKMADSLVSFDAIKEDKSQRYKKNWPKRMTNNIDHNNNNMTHIGKIKHGYTPNSKSNSHELVEDNQVKNLIVNSTTMNQPIQNKFKNLNFVKNRLISNYEVKYKKPLQSEKYRHEKTVKINKNQDGTMYTNQEEPIAKDFAYNKIIKRHLSVEPGSSFDDGYSSASGSNRTAFSEINNYTKSGEENNFIMSLTEELNCGSNDMTNDNEINATSSNRQQAFIQDVANFEYTDEKEDYTKEETHTKESIHSKLEDLLKRKPLNTETRSRLNTYKFSDPMLQNDKVDGPTDIIEKKEYGKPDASFNSDRTDPGAPRITRERKPPRPEHDEFNFGDTKRSLINELSRTISRRESFSEDPITKEYLQGESNKFKLDLGDDFRSNYQEHPTDEFPPPPNLYDMFPLPTDRSNEDPSEKLLEERVLAPKEIPNEDPINIDAVTTMLKSHLKDKQKENRSKRGKADKKFSFASTDLMERDTTKFDYSTQNGHVKANHQIVEEPATEFMEYKMDDSYDQMEELYKKQKRLSLEYEEGDFSMREQFDDSKIFDPSNFSLTESDLKDAKKDLPRLQPDVIAAKRLQEDVVTSKNMDKPQTSTPRKQDEILKDQVDGLILKSANRKPIRRDINNNEIIKQSKAVPIDNYSKSRVQNNSTSTDDIAIAANTRQSNPRVLRKQESRTELYLPENNDEKLIRPSEFRIHKFKDRSRYRDPNPPQVFAELKIDSSRLTDSSSTKVQKVEKRHASPMQKISRVPTEKMEIDQVDRTVTGFISSGEDIIKRNAPRHRSKTEGRHAWENQPYVPQNVGKVNIPTSFQNQKSALKSPEASPRPSAPKKTRSFSYSSDQGNDKSKQGRKSGKVKQLFSPKLSKKQKSSSMDSIPLSVSSNRTLSTTVWGFSDDEASLNGNLTGSDYYGDDDTIDTNFISDEEWVDSHRNSPTSSKNTTRDNTPRNGKIPQIKAPLMPGVGSIKLSGRESKNVGRVIVPDAFSNKINHKESVPTTKRNNNKSTTNGNELISYATDDRYQIQLLTSDVPFNSFDINTSIRKTKKEQRKNIRTQHQPIVIRKR